MKRVAICLFGLSYEKYKHWSSKIVLVDYKKSVDNYKNILFKYFQDLGYKIDVYICTNNINKVIELQLYNDYKPCALEKCSTKGDNHISRNVRFMKVLSKSLENNIQYDNYVITRFDLEFKQNFSFSNIQLEKLNIVSILEKTHLICDNFYIVPKYYIEPFYKICSKNCYKKSFHYILSDIQTICEPHFILNEYDYVDKLSFYKIIRTYLPVEEDNAKTETEAEAEAEAKSKLWLLSTKTAKKNIICNKRSQTMNVRFTKNKY